MHNYVLLKFTGSIIFFFHELHLQMKVDTRIMHFIHTVYVETLSSVCLLRQLNQSTSAPTVWHVLLFIFIKKWRRWTVLKKITILSNETSIPLWYSYYEISYYLLSGIEKVTVLNSFYFHIHKNHVTTTQQYRDGGYFLKMK